jgi:hypothetical protein
VASLQCHKAKNLVPEAGKDATKTGQAVRDIQVRDILFLVVSMPSLPLSLHSNCVVHFKLK